MNHTERLQLTSVAINDVIHFFWIQIFISINSFRLLISLMMKMPKIERIVRKSISFDKTGPHEGCGVTGAPSDASAIYWVSA